MRKCKLCNQDEIIWNLAIRSNMPQCLSYYQQILTYYPSSNYAPEAQWRIFWPRIKQSKDKSLIAIGNWCAAAANKYSQSKLAPRFMFWAGKINEVVSNKEQAAIYYQQTQDLYPTDYYGQRAKCRYADIKNGQKDNYFALQSPIKNIVPEWDWPMVNTENLQVKENNTVSELIYLKQYDEVLAQNSDLPVEIVAGLNGKTKRPLLAINIAANGLKEHKTSLDNRKSVNDTLLWQYSYPLLYDKEITAYSRMAGLADPLFLHALIREESRYEARAISNAKALGLCQLMPATAAGVAKSQGINIIDASQLYDPDLNIRLGSSYLSS